MTPSQAQTIEWSEDKHKELESELQGFWAKDEWPLHECPLLKERNLTPTIKQGLFLRFKCKSNSLNTELKYGYYQKYTSGEWSIKSFTNASCLSKIVNFLNEVAPNINSLLQKSLERWVLLLRSYLIETGKCWKTRPTKHFDSSGNIREYDLEDRSLYTFRQIYKIIEYICDNRPEYEKDIWDIRKLGLKFNEAHKAYKLNFTTISQIWLREAVKRFIWFSSATSTPTQKGCANKLHSLVCFSTFLAKRYRGIKASEINRAVIIQFLGELLSQGLSESTRLHRIVHLKEFLEVSAREGWADVTDKPLVYKGDTPRLPETNPRFIAEDILKQINQHVDCLPPHVMRMVLILQECGMRASELCTLPFNCIKEDGHGDWFLHYRQGKMNKDHTQPISKEIVAIIQEQQQVVTQEWGVSFAYLFPTPKPHGKGKPITYSTFLEALNKLGYEKNICDLAGRPCRFTPHQFRHTVATKMINSGVPHHIVQRYMGHASPDMTSRYAHIHDQTLKAEFAKFQNKMVDVTGKVVAYESVAAEIAGGSDLNGVDTQWLKKNIRAQALPNGLCGLPASQPACPYGANKCLTGADGKGCAHFKTDTRYLDKHKEHLARTNEVVEWAQENPGAKRAEEILKVNQPVKQNLERIVTSLENSGTHNSNPETT